MATFDRSLASGGDRNVVFTHELINKPRTDSKSTVTSGSPCGVTGPFGGGLVLGSPPCKMARRKAARPLLPQLIMG
jgi:hypothetical protein